MSNSLIIGLGGTGEKIIREFRKRYFEEFHSFESQDGCHVEYLYADSDEGALKTEWRASGTSIALSNAQKVSTHGMSLSDLHQLENRPQLKSFISHEEVDIIEANLGKIISEGIGGQRRRLGRMLLASHMTRPDGFLEKLKGRVRSLQNKSNHSDVHFHICAGLAGGTGSGSVIDTIAMVRKEYGDSVQIHLYLYIPEHQTLYTDNIEYYKANGYAALQEINAIAAGIYHPVDITGDKDPYTNSFKRIVSDLPINGSYLFTNVNERGRILDLKDELPQMVADFLFQKIYVDQDSTLNEKLRRIEKFENGNPIEEVDALGNRVRSVRFLSFGLRRVIFPETEIKEYIAYKLAERATLQMHYDNWTSGGYTTISRENATDDITMSLIANDRETLFLGDKILMRESSLPGGEPVQDFFETFKAPSNGFSQDALELDREEWLNFYNGHMGAFFKKKFRRMGVVAYFAQEITDAPKYARKIVNAIEQALFEKWENGTYGALQIEEYMSLLLKDCDKRTTEFSKSVKDSERKLEEMRGILTDMQEDVTKTGIIGNIFGKRQDRFLEYCDYTRNYYIERTNLEAKKYAIILLGCILTSLQELESNIIRFSALLSLMTEKSQELGSQRCGDESMNDAKTLRKYDRSAVNEIKDKTVRTEESQAQIARTVRSALVSQISEASSKGFSQFLKTFKAYDGKIDNAAENALNVVFDICKKATEKEVEDRSLDDARLKVTNVNILEKLRQEYDDISGEKLRSFAHEIMESAQTFVKFNESEVSLAANGNHNRKMSAVIVYLPEETDDSGFRERLTNALKDAKGDPEKVSVLKSHRNDQIAVMAVTSMFPLRYVENVKSLKDAYDKLINSPNSSLHKLVLHTETFEEPLPSIFEASAEEMAVELPKPVILGWAMGIIRESTDSATGRTGMYLFTTDKYGDAERSEQTLGKDFLAVIKTLTANQKEAAKLKKEVKNRLASEYVHVDSRRALMERVNRVLRTVILEACGGDEFGGEYGKYKKVRNEIGDNELNID